MLHRARDVSVLGEVVDGIRGEGPVLDVEDRRRDFSEYLQPVAQGQQDHGRSPCHR